MSKKILPIYELLSNKTWIDYFNNRAMTPMLGESLFPVRVIPTMKYEYILGADDIPVTAHFHAFNTESEIASREGREKAAAELGMIKRKITMDEELIKQLSEPRNIEEYNDNVTTLFESVEKLYKSILTRLEIARFEILQTGELKIKENGIDMSLSFKMPSTHKVESGIDWTSNDADIIGDLTAWCDLLQDEGMERPTRAVTSTRVLQLLTKNLGIRKALYGINSDMVTTMLDVNRLFEVMELPKFVAYDGVYKEEDKKGILVQKRYLSKDRVVLLPSEPIGNTLFTPTPEHVVLKRDPSIQPERLGNIVVMSWFESFDPIGWQTKAVTCSMPSFPQVKKVFSAKVY